MKKILFLILGACVLFSMISCEKSVNVTEEELIGKWQTVSVQYNGVSVPLGSGDYKIWEFTADHRFLENDGFVDEWALEGSRIILGEGESSVTYSITLFTGDMLGVQTVIFEEGTRYTISSTLERL